MKLYAVDLRTRTLFTIFACCILIFAIFFGAWLYGEQGQVSNLAWRKMAPGWNVPFGTDWLGRDIFARTLKGLCLSMEIGLVAATCSTVIALVLGLAAATLGRAVDVVVTWLVDVGMATPHLVLLIMISFACGGGAKGVIIAVAVSHWPALTRVVRAEVMQLRTSEYIQLSRRLGKSPGWIACHHFLPHVIPQFLVGLLLLFPHAILHEAGLTFLGFGMSPHTPAIGAMLSESMRYLFAGMWWSAVAPGFALLLAVKTFDILGNNVRALLDPKTLRQ